MAQTCNPSISGWALYHLATAKWWLNLGVKHSTTAKWWLKPVTPQSRVEHPTTEPLQSDGLNPQPLHLGSSTLPLSHCKVMAQTRNPSISGRAPYHWATAKWWLKPATPPSWVEHSTTEPLQSDGSNPQPLHLRSSILPLSHCKVMAQTLNPSILGRAPYHWATAKWWLKPEPLNLRSSILPLSNCKVMAQTRNPSILGRAPYHWATAKWCSNPQPFYLRVEHSTTEPLQSDGSNLQPLYLGSSTLPLSHCKVMAQTHNLSISRSSTLPLSHCKVKALSRLLHDAVCLNLPWAT